VGGLSDPASSYPTRITRSAPDRFQVGDEADVRAGLHAFLSGTRDKLLETLMSVCTIRRGARLHRGIAGDRELAAGSPVTGATTPNRMARAPSYRTALSAAAPGDVARSEITPAPSKVSVPGSSPLTPPSPDLSGVEDTWDSAGAAAQDGGTERESGSQASLQFTTAHTVLP
jgi:hypothetical protein